MDISVSRLTPIKLVLQPTAQVFWHGYGKGVPQRDADPVIVVRYQFYRGEDADVATILADIPAYVMCLLDEKKTQQKGVVLMQLKFRFSSLIVEIELIGDFSDVDRVDRLFLASQVTTFLGNEEIRSNTFERLQNGPLVLGAREEED